MPELPEVETIRRELIKDILNKKILDINILYPNIIKSNIDEFKKKLINEEFINIKRKGKYLIFETNNYYILSHLMMEGKYFYEDINYNITKHDHLIYEFKENLLIYNDTRKFGRIKLINKEDLEKELSHLGLEPKDLTYTYLRNKLNKNKKIKPLLLDQSIISGLGNIYANEVLFLSKINPHKKGSKLSKRNIENIVRFSNVVINKSIEEGGTTIHSYKITKSKTGNYQNYLKVHLKKDCPICHSKITKDYIDGRSVYYCKKCQK